MKKASYTFKGLLIALALGILMPSCEHDDSPVPDVPPSDGTTMKLNGGQGGSSAENTVFVDLSTNKQSAVKRSAWDLGFYNGEEFRVILNNTAGASAVSIEASDLNQVSASGRFKQALG